MHPTNCLNCETLLTADDNYCPNCGQKTDTHRITFKHIVHEFLHAFTHADKGFLGMIGDLLVRPGVVAREYVKGKRKKYFSPFTFFLLSVGILVFSGHYFAVFEEHQKADPQVMAKLAKSPAAQKEYLRIIERSNIATDFVSKHMNNILMLVVPFYALIGWIFFGRRGYNYSEILLAYILFQSIVAIFMAIGIMPWIAKFKGESIFYYAYGVFILTVCIYIGTALYSFLGYKNKWMVICTSLVALLGYLLVVLTIIFSLLYYLFGSKMWFALEKVWEKYF
jgi:hypothetical protein